MPVKETEIKWTKREEVKTKQNKKRKNNVSQLKKSGCS